MLNDRERHILEASRLAEIPITLRGLPEEFGVSLESVRLIGVRALEKVQTAVKNGVAAIEISVPSAALERVPLRLTIPFMWSHRRHRYQRGWPTVCPAVSGNRHSHGATDVRLRRDKPQADQHQYAG